MRTHHIEYADTGRFSKLVLDHLAGDDFLGAFRQFAPTLEGLREAAGQRRFPEANRAALLQALRKQYHGLELGSEVSKSLDDLSHPDALAVTTGHQLCLFLGPLYTTYKLLNTIRLSRLLSSDLGRPVVPVFWMASEDHDRAEIDHAWIGSSKVEWPGQAGGAVGRLPLDGITGTVEEAARLISHTAHGARLAELIRECYAPGRTLAEATRRFVHALFGRFGLVIIDGDDRALKEHFIPVMREELVNGIAHRAVTYADELLRERYEPQAHARQVNLFHLRAGHRSRIERQAGQFQVLDGGPRFSLDELLLDMELRPQDYSPNVLLRPVYQETVLPNVAYIGGGGELAYWMQLRWLFQAVQVPMPAVLLRTSAALLSPAVEALRQKMNLSLHDLFLPEHVLVNKAVHLATGVSTAVDTERDSVHRALDELSRRAKAIDPTLEMHVAAVQARMNRQLEGIGQRMDRALRRREAVQVARVQALMADLFPRGGLQERRESVLPWLAAHGDRFLDELLDALDPLDNRFTLVAEA